MMLEMNEDFPTLPDGWDTSALPGLEETALGQAASDLGALERLMLAWLAPYSQKLKELKARQAEVATEVRRRQRSARHAQRKEVQAAAGNEMPTLASVLSDNQESFASDMPIASVVAFLASGGQVGFGFATKPGYIALTNGREMEYAGTFGRARELWQSGWELGTPQIPGVRVHLAGTLVERVVSSEDVVLKV